MNPNQFTIKSLLKWTVYAAVFWGVAAGTFFEYREMFTGAVLYAMVWVPMLMLAAFLYVVFKWCGWV